MKSNYNKYSDYLKEKYGTKVRKLTIDAGYSCPNQQKHGKEGCIFCRNDSFSQMQSTKKILIREQVQQGIEFAQKRFHSTKFIPYFQSSTNTFAPIHILRHDYYEAIDHPDIVGLVISTRPDCLNTAVLELVEEIAAKIDVTIELGLQSIHDNTLKFLNRGHTYQDYLDAVQLLQTLPVRICTHLMIGLPGESRKDILETANDIAGSSIHEVKVHPLLILKDTPLEILYKEGNITSLELDDYCELAVDFLELLSPKFVIQRLTAEALGDVLIAPRWTRNKLRALQTIDKEFIKRGTWQGKKFRAQSSHTAL